MIKMENFEIGQHRAPFIIAEMSGNHNQSLERALEIVEAAAKTGSHALKIQTDTPDTMTLDLDERGFHISDPNSLWAGRLFTSFTARPTHRGNGINRFSIGRVSWA